MFWHFLFSVLITQGKNEVGECRKDNFPSSKSLGILSPQRIISSFTGKKRKVSLDFMASHLSACKALPHKIEGSHQINQYWCINMFMSRLCANMSLECRDLPCTHLMRRAFPPKESGFQKLLLPGCVVLVT